MNAVKYNCYLEEMIIFEEIVLNLFSLYIL